MNSKSILISIKPEWVEKILDGSKTIEIRKSIPKCKLPIKVYIYCTKGQELWGDGTGNTWYGIAEDEDMERVFELTPTLARLNGKVVAEFTLNKCERIRAAYVPYEKQNNLGYEYFIENGVYNLDNSDWGVVFERGDNFINSMLKKSDFNKICLKPKELFNYTGNKKFYMWHIDDLIIYDKPKGLNEFRKPCISPEMPYCLDCKVGYESMPESEAEFYRAGESCRTEWCCLNFIKRPPQSWCYVQVINEN